MKKVAKHKKQLKKHKQISFSPLFVIVTIVALITATYATNQQIYSPEKFEAQAVKGIQAEAPAITVSDIEITAVGPYWGWRHIKTTVSVIEQTSGVPVSNPNIGLRLENPETNSVANITGAGNTSGKLSHGFWTDKTGTLIATINSVFKNGYNYVPTITTKTLIIQ